MLKLARVVKAEKQVVAGALHHPALEVDDAGGNKIYEAKIWVKPWENFKELQEFNHIPHPDHDVQKVMVMEISVLFKGEPNQACVHLAVWNMIEEYTNILTSWYSKNIKSITHSLSSHYGVLKPDGEGSGYQSVPVHDPVVQDAANHLKTLQQGSNSLYPYELQEVVHAKAETVEGSAKYDILVNLKRNDKEEKYKANLHKDNDGKFHVNNMVQDHS
ncbi:cystatin B [Artemisia annua]|uniref:Cysteine proteinase inhibitor n=1 Tax=Artemisia annua TaxID=35608 RepID=A0A2U1MMY1_ARTAN|nr:cystatin B [Artemisia annua]